MSSSICRIAVIDKVNYALLHPSKKLPKDLKGLRIDVLQHLQNENKRIKAECQQAINTAAHDLKSPLNSISALCALMKNTASNGQYSEKEINSYLDVIQETIQFSFNKTRNMLVPTIAELGQLKMENFNLRHSVAEETKTIKGTAMKKEIEVILDIDEKIEIAACKNVFDTVMGNLLSNAVKFTEKGGLITISAKIEENFIKASVSNTGQKIDSEDIEKIFGKIGVHTTLGTAGEKGTNYGLPTCRKLLEKQGGNIWAENSDKGPVFAFTLPIKPDEAEL